jgi:hypothetical protein
MEHDTPREVALEYGLQPPENTAVKTSTPVAPQVDARTTHENRLLEEKARNVGEWYKQELPNQLYKFLQHPLVPMRLENIQKLLAEYKQFTIDGLIK